MVAVKHMDEAREILEEIFLDLYKHSDTDWSIYADWFIEWNVDRGFKTKSFDEFTEWMYLDNRDLITKHKVWDFFYGWVSLEDFVNSFIVDSDKRDVLRWIKQNKKIDNTTPEQTQTMDV